jgi:hypothetical protein
VGLRMTAGERKSRARERRRQPSTEALAGLRDASATVRSAAASLTHSGSSFTTSDRLREYVLGIRLTN